MKRWMALLLCVLMLASCTPKAENPTGEQTTAGETAQKQNRSDTKIRRTQEEKDKGWKIFPDMGVKYLMDSAVWKANGAYLYTDLVGNLRYIIDKKYFDSHIAQPILHATIFIL